MKTKILFIFFFLIPLFSFSQINLVPNYSFEINDSCPDAEDQIERATGWQKVSAVSSTPNYFNACAPAGYYNVPHTGHNFQINSRNCNAFAGIITYSSPLNNYREIIGIQLAQQLIIGQEYFLSFKFTLSEFKIGNNYYGMPSNSIGIKLSTIYYNIANPVPLENSSHLNNFQIINDTVNWYQISGSFIAD
jgi:hypothetical protein